MDNSQQTPETSGGTSPAQPEVQPDPPPGGSCRDRNAAAPWGSGWHGVELLAVFAIGLAVMSLFYTEPGQSRETWGVPGYDSFYHIKMAELLPEIGLVDRFDWLRTTIFYKDRFVNHHWGFQALMVPFIAAAKWLGHDAMTGARWAIAVFFGLVMAAFHLLLQSGRVRFRWMWLGLFLAMPFQFFSRHAFVRAIDLSLLCMLLLIFFMFRRRYVAAGVVVALYIHVYLGGVIYAPLIVGAYFLAGLVSPQGERVSWKLVFWTALGWGIGLSTHPYAGGAIRFLQVQVFGSGLTPDIPVGREWKSYEGLWWFATMTGVMWVVLGAAVCLRLRSGRQINARELSLLLINFAFLVLVCKSRRFIEYWPVFCLLSSAYLVAPLLHDLLPELARGAGDRVDHGLRWVPALLMGAVCAALVAGCVVMLPKLGIENFAAEWRVWGLLAGLYFLAPIGRWLVTTRTSAARGSLRIPALVAIAGAGSLLVLIVVGTLWLAYRGADLPRPLLPVPGWTWAALGGLYVVAPLVAMKRGRPGQPQPLGRRATTALTILFVAASFVLLLVLTVAAQLVNLQRSIYCGFDLAAIERAMNYLKAESPASSVVFTDDWDVFPVFFYYNHHNHYIVGLDPKFTHEADPELWERYKKLSRGQFPSTTEVKFTDDEGNEVRRKIRVKIDDIIDYFGCSYVITDRDHRALARKLEAAPAYARRIYPVNGSIDDVRNPPYKVFRVFKPPERDAAPGPAPPAGRRPPASDESSHETNPTSA